MKKKVVIPFEKIFTPQGMLGEVSQNPNLDFMMNIFNIPRVYGVSGFGEWDVGKHTMATALLALYWSKFNKFKPEKRDRLVTLALVHDAHEAVTGDILPYFKTPEVKNAIETIQNNILNSFDIDESGELKKELKLIDLISFLYEISQSSPKGLDISKRKLIEKMYNRQKDTIYDYVREQDLDYQNVKKFLEYIEL